MRFPVAVEPVNITRLYSVFLNSSSFYPLNTHTYLFSMPASFSSVVTALFTALDYLEYFSIIMFPDASAPTSGIRDSWMG